MRAVVAPWQPEPGDADVTLGVRYQREGGSLFIARSNVYMIKGGIITT